MILQQIFSSDPSLNYTGGVTGYFGLKTQAAVEAFQVKYGVVQPGLPGYGSVGPKTRAMLVQVYGA
jgi:peptidoglycan hydrolase-like protein with peptidoglycan-binding domain